MANTVDIQTLVDGPRNLVLKIYLESDGAAGELSAQTIVDVSTYSGAPSEVKIKRIQSDLTGFSASLLWDATTNEEIVNLSEGEGERDYCKFGGLINNAGAGKTGDILLTTEGFAAAGDRGSIVLEMAKRG